MTAGEERELQLGADAVGGGDQHRVAIALQTEASAEAADVGEHVGGEGAARHFANGFDGAVGFVDIDSRVLVTYGLFFRHVLIESRTTGASAAR